MQSAKSYVSFSHLQWFNLNSLLAKPELITETYLSLYLTQLQTEGDQNLSFVTFIDFL